MALTQATLSLSEQDTFEMQQQSALTNKLLSRASQSRDDEKDGSGQDYDPLDSAEQLQAEKDKIDDATNDDAKESTDITEVAASAHEIDESVLVNSEQFAEELQSAIDHVTSIAKSHRAEMIRAAKQQFERETGSAPTQRMVDEAMETMKESLITVEPEITSTEPATTEDLNVKSSETELDGVSAEDMESALEHVRSLGRKHRVEFEKRISAQFADINGAAPSTEELSGIFARIREALAEEARDEFLDIHDQEELDGDSDYEPTADEFTNQYFKDNADDVAAESEDVDINAELVDLRDDSLLSDSDESEVDSRSTELSERELQSADTASTFDEAHFSGEMDFALKHVRDLAALQKGEFVNSVCDIYAELNGCEPSLAELKDVFADITAALAVEAECNGIAWDIPIDDFVFTDADYRPSEDTFDYAQDEVDQQLFDEVMLELDDELLGADMDFALEHVRNLANVHQKELVNKICDMFAEEYGREASVAHLRDLFSEVKQDFAIEAAEQTEDEVSQAGSVSASVEVDKFDEEAFDEDLGFALEHVRELASLHQREFVNKICDLYAEENDAEPSAVELTALFGGIQQLFAEEADKEGTAFIVSVGDSASESVAETESEQESDGMSEQDSYDPDEDSFDYALDAEDDIEFEFELDTESEIESESIEESEAQSEVYSERDEYNPSEDSMDYGADTRDSVDFASSVSESASEVESESESAAVSESELSIDVSALEQDIESALNEEMQEADAELFADEMQSALEHISELGRAHQEQFVNTVCESFAELNGEEPSVAELYGLFGSIKQDFAEEAQEEDADESSSEAEDELSESESVATVSEAESKAATDDEFDEELFADEMDSALINVRELASSHREGFVNSLCDIISAQNEQEPTAAELYGVFGSIKQSFAEEALEDSVSTDAESASEQESEVDLSEEDSYDPEQDSFDYALDVEADFATDSECADYSLSTSEEEQEEIGSEAETELSVSVLSKYESEDVSQSEEEESDDMSEQDSYDPEEDSFDYAVDAADDFEFEFDLDAASEIESESVEESEAQSEDYSERDSYSPSNDSFDYAVDADDLAAFNTFASDASESEAESESESVAESVSVSESDVSTEFQARPLRNQLGETAREALIHRIYDLYAAENEQDATTNDVRDILADVKQRFADEAVAESDESELSESEAQSEADSASEEFEENIGEFVTEFPSALESVRELAATHRLGFVNTLCDIISAENDQEPTADDLFAAFDVIKQSFADEALEESESVESEQDDNYDPDEDSFDYAIDAEDDIDSEFQIDADSEIESALEDADLSEQDSYAPAEDSFDYGVDEQDDFAFESEAEFDENDTASVDEVSLETEEAFAEEMASALAHVQRLGRAQCAPLIDAIYTIYSKCTGEEPTLSQLRSAFGDIRRSFADEAQEDSSDEESESVEASYAESTDVAVGTEYSTEEEQSEDEEDDEDLSERDSYDPEDDSFDYAVDDSSSRTASVEESEDGGESYDPSDDSFDYAVDVADSIDFVSESGSETENESDEVSYD